MTDLTPTSSSHYDSDYFAWQRESGRFGGWANVDKYKDTVKPDDTVLDFGCGGGFLLANLTCSRRIGVEPNPDARATAEKNGVTAFARPADAMAALGPQSVDVIISDNALEHALEPWVELRAIRELLKPGGLLHIVVPCEGPSWAFKDDDVNQHVYSWSPQSLGNLLKAAGYEIIAARPYRHKWPPKGLAQKFAAMGRPTFNAASRLWAHIDRRWVQVEAIARNPAIADEPAA